MDALFVKHFPEMPGKGSDAFSILHKALGTLRIHLQARSFTARKYPGRHRLLRPNNLPAETLREPGTDPQVRTTHLERTARPAGPLRSAYAM